MSKSIFSITKKSLKIGILPLSAPLAPPVVQEAVAFLKQEGHDPIELLDPSKDYGQLAYLFSCETPQKRADALESALLAEPLDLILVSRGGYGAIEILPLLDFSRISQSSKLICGFSDATTVLTALNQRADLICVHGPNLASFREEVEIGVRRDNLNSLLKLIFGDRTTLFGAGQFRPICSGKAQGLLLGGNLSALSALIGTPWAPKFNGKIFFFEEVGESPFRLHRMLTQLKLSGSLDGVRGLLVGHLTGCVHRSGAPPDAEAVIRDVLGDLGVPVYLGADFGHGTINSALPLGVLAQLSDNGLELL